MIHPREMLVTQARMQLTDALIAWRKRNAELTVAELVSVITGEMSSMLLGIAKFAIRHERHGDADKPGGLV